MLAMGYTVYLFQPHGYRNLQRLENLANGCTSPGKNIVEVRACFQATAIAPKIDFEPYLIESDEAPPLISGLLAHKGDTVMATTTQSGAIAPFPCGRVDLKIVLVFGSDERLRERLVKRFYTCP
jgi:hypothetical protein